jgi:phage terminase small subunit
MAGHKPNILKSSSELTPKQRRFAEILVENWGNITKQKAAEQAGYKVTNSTGAKLTDPNINPHIHRYIEKLYALALKKKERDKLRHYNKFEELRDKAVEKNQFSAAINAEFKIGQAAGFYIDRKEITTNSLEGLTREQLETRLQELERKMADAKPVIEAQVIEEVRD